MEEDTRGFWFRQPRHPRAPKPKVETEEVLQVIIETEGDQETEGVAIEEETILQSEEEVAEGELVEVVGEED